MRPIGGAVLGLQILEGFRYGSNTSLRDGSSGFASGMRTRDAADIPMPPFSPLSHYITSVASTHTIKPHTKK